MNRRAPRLLARSPTWVASARTTRTPGTSARTLLAVCDGVGGAARGDIASSTAIAQLRKLEEAPPGPDTSDSDLLGAGQQRSAPRARPDRRAGRREPVPRRHQHHRHRRALRRRRGSAWATSATPARTCSATASSASSPTTTPSSRRLIDEGRITEAEARVHPHSNLILKAIDGTHDLEPDLFVLELKLGDRLLLCSDGARRPRRRPARRHPLQRHARLRRRRAGPRQPRGRQLRQRHLPGRRRRRGQPRRPRHATTLRSWSAPPPTCAPAGPAAPRRGSLFRGHRAGDTGELEPIRAEIPDEVGFAIRSDPVPTPRRCATHPIAPGRFTWLSRLLVLAVVVGVALADRRGRLVVEPGPVLRRRGRRHGRHLPRPRRLAARHRPVPSLRDAPTSPSTGSATSTPARCATGSARRASTTPATRSRTSPRR